MFALSWYYGNMNNQDTNAWMKMNESDDEVE